jgi:hypothetical protein
MKAKVEARMMAEVEENFMFLLISYKYGFDL